MYIIHYIYEGKSFKMRGNFYFTIKKVSHHQFISNIYKTFLLVMFPRILLILH